MESNSTERPLVIFDGICAACNRFVRFVVPRDHQQSLYFASNLSAVAREAIAGKLEHEELSHTIAVVTESGAVLTRSDAIIYIASKIGWPFRAVSLLKCLPRPLRDFGYSIGARLRYRLFGTVSECALIEPELRKRFLS